MTHYRENYLHLLKVQYYPVLMVHPVLTGLCCYQLPCQIDVLEASITQPGNGARVSGVIQVSGAATVDNFDYYKFEFRPSGGDWSFIQRYDNAVLGGVLGSWNTGTASAGEYEFRLVVVDNIGNYPEPCTIRLIVQ